MALASFKGLVKELTLSAEQRAVARALKHFANGQIDRAIETLKEAHARAPEDTGILFEMARVLTCADRAAEGADALRSILRREPKALGRVNEVIEEIRVRHRQVGALFDPLVEHFVRHGDLKAGLEAMERMGPEEVRAVAPRHAAKRAQARREAPKARLVRTLLASFYHLALCHEALKEHGAAAEVYLDAARTNPDELDRVLPRLEALVAKDYQNGPLRVAVGALLLDAGRAEDAARHLAMAIEADAGAARAVADRVVAHLKARGDRPDLRWVLAAALRAAGDDEAAIDAMRPLVEADARLDDVITALTPLAEREKGGPARRLLAEALRRGGRPREALEVLLRVADEEGAAAIAAPLQALADSHPDMARAQHLLADMHLAAGRTAAATGSLRRVRELAPGEATVLVGKVARALQADPASSEAHLLLADLLIDAGDRVRAVIALRHMVREDPTAAEPALERLTACLDDPGVPRALLGAAEACLALGRHAEALAHLERLGRGRPELEFEFLHAVAVLAGMATDLAPRVVALLDDLKPRSTAPAAIAFARAEALFFGGDPAAAAGAFSDVLQAAPERSEEIRRALERFDRDDPRSTEAGHLLAVLHLDRRDYEAALTELSRGEGTNPALMAMVLGRFEAIVRETPDDVAARVGFLRALLRGGQPDRVLALGEETLALAGAAAGARVLILMAAALARKGDLDGSVRRYHAAYRRDPRVLPEALAGLEALGDAGGAPPLAHLVRGGMLAAEGRAGDAVEALQAAATAEPALRDAALKELDALARSRPGDPKVGLAAIGLLRDKGDARRALAAISTHLDAHPGSAPALAAHLEAILKADPSQPLAHYELGRAAQRLGARARAAGCFLQAVRLDVSLAPLALKRLKEIADADAACVVASLAIASILATRGKPLAAAETLAAGVRARPAEAERLLQGFAALRRESRDAGRIALLHAGACLSAGQHRQALEAYGEAAERDPSLLDTAREGLDAVVAACPRMPEAHLARGRLHARRMNFDAALADLIRVTRLAPRLGPVVAIEMEGLRRSFPEARGGSMFLADLYAADGRAAEAAALLRRESERGSGNGDRLPILLRLASLLARGGDGSGARACLDQAARLQPDRDRFLAAAHEVRVALLRGEAERVADQNGQQPAEPGTISRAALALVDLGEVERARALVEKRAPILGERETARLRAAIALRQGDFLRASEALKALGPGRLLAFGAARAGDLPLASRTLEQLISAGSDEALVGALGRLYREMVAADLLGGSRRLQAETILTFNQREAA